MNRLETKIQKAITLLQKMESTALKLSPQGFLVAFSGGKDSQVILELCRMANVKHHAEMQVTTIDPPELMKFVRTHYPDVKRNYPDINFYDLIVKKNASSSTSSILLPTPQRTHRSRNCHRYWSTKTRITKAC